MLSNSPWSRYYKGIFHTWVSLPVLIPPTSSEEEVTGEVRGVWCQTNTNFHPNSVTHLLCNLKQIISLNLSACL